MYVNTVGVSKHVTPEVDLLYLVTGVNINSEDKLNSQLKMLKSEKFGRFARRTHKSLKKEGSFVC